MRAAENFPLSSKLHEMNSAVTPAISANLPICAEMACRNVQVVEARPAVPGWLLPLDFGVVPCSKCHSRDFIGQYRKRPVYHLNRSLGGRRLVRLPGMAASNVCERVLSTRCRPPDIWKADAQRGVSRRGAASSRSVRVDGWVRTLWGTHLRKTIFQPTQNPRCQMQPLRQIQTALD